MEEIRFLSTSESVVMKAIWDNTTEDTDISIPDLIEALDKQYGKEYARTTVVTFLLKLSDKNFVKTYRKSKLSYAHPIKSLDEYRLQMLEEHKKFWYSGDSSKMFEDVKQITINC